MPSWGELLRELGKLQHSNPQNAQDLLRRKYISTLHQHTKRVVIVYATKWTQTEENIPPDLISVSDEDIQGLMEAIHGTKGDQLDLILHSPGGSLEASDAFVQYLRSQFSHIRVFVPHAAMSAATMIALAADEIVMGKHSFLGPTDPQFTLHTPLGPRMVPAQAILDQFKLAKEECDDPKNLSAWLPMLQQYGPDLLNQCHTASNLSAELVQDWLTEYMFRNDADGPQKAKSIATWLSNHSEFKSHSKHIGRENLRQKGLNIVNLETDKQLQDAILSIYHAVTHTFNTTGAVKLIENHQGNSFIKQMQAVMMQAPAWLPSSMPPPFGHTGHEKKKR